MSFASPCSALDVVCPPKISTVQKLGKKEAGWREFVRPDAEGKVDVYSGVQGISIYSDDPEKIAELKPDNEDGSEPYWSFERALADEPPLYMACSYFGTRIKIVRVLPKNVKKCIAKRNGLLRCEVFNP